MVNDVKIKSLNDSLAQLRKRVDATFNVLSEIYPRKGEDETIDGLWTIAGGLLAGDTEPNIGTSGTPFDTLYVNTIYASTVFGEAMSGAEWEISAQNGIIDLNYAGTGRLDIVNQSAGQVADVSIEHFLRVGSVGDPSDALDVDGDANVSGSIVVGGTVDGVDIATFESNYNTHTGDPDAHHAGFIGLEDTSSTVVTPSADDRIQLTSANNILGIMSGTNVLTFTIAQGNIDHSSIGGLSNDDHPQYAALAQNETVTGEWTFTGNIDVQESGGVADISITTYNNTWLLSQLKFRGSRGTSAASLSVEEGDWIGAFAAYGMSEDDGSFQIGSGIALVAAEDWTPTDRGSRIEFYTIPIGASSLGNRMSLLPDGELEFQQASIISTVADNLTLSPASNLVLSPVGDLILDPAGNDVLPNMNYDINLGMPSKKYLTLHAAELWVETLVAQDTMATIGGRILVGPTTKLTSDLESTANKIEVEHNNLSVGDIVVMESNGKLEWMAVVDTPIGSGPYEYDVTRDLVGIGASEWYAGDAVFNTGTIGDGFIDLYSLAGVTAGSTAGPTIAGQVRYGTTYNHYREAWAIGNLNGLYGYGTDTYGVAFGQYDEANYMTVDPTGGVRFLDSSNVVRGQLSSTTWTLGSTTTEHVAISTLAVQIKDGTKVYTDLTAGVLSLGDTDNEHALINTSGLSFKDGSTVLATYATSGIELFANSIKVVDIDGSNGDFIFGQVATDKANLFWDQSTGRLNLRGGTDGTEVGLWLENDGTLMAGNGHVILDETRQTIVSSGESGNYVRWVNEDIVVGTGTWGFANLQLTDPESDEYGVFNVGITQGDSGGNYQSNISFWREEVDIVLESAGSWRTVAEFKYGSIHLNTHLLADEGIHVGGSSDPGEDNLIVDGGAAFGNVAVPADGDLRAGGSLIAGYKLSCDYDNTATDTGGIYWYYGNGSTVRTGHFYIDVINGDDLRVVKGETQCAYIDSTSGWQAGSNRKLKTSFVTLDDLQLRELGDELLATPIYQYERKDKLGFLEVGPVADEAPRWMVSDDRWGINYLRSIGYLTAINKSQEDRIRKLEKRVAILES